MLATLPAALHVGSYSTGTLQPHDVIPVMLNVLRALVSDDAAEMEKEYANIGHEQFDELSLFWSELEEKIDDALPRGFYWGTAEGDGADFGIWQIEDEDLGDTQTVYAKIEVRPLHGHSAKDVVQSALEYAVEIDNMHELEVVSVLPKFRRRKYVAESSGNGKHSIYEYKCDSEGNPTICVRTVQYGLPRKEAEKMASDFNDVVARFLFDNGIDA